MISHSNTNNQTSDCQSDNKTFAGNFVGILHKFRDDPSISSDVLSVITYWSGRIDHNYCRKDVMGRFGWGRKRWDKVAIKLRELGFLFDDYDNRLIFIDINKTHIPNKLLKKIKLYKKDTPSVSLGDLGTLETVQNLDTLGLPRLPSLVSLGDHIHNNNKNINNNNIDKLSSKMEPPPVDPPVLSSLFFEKLDQA